MSTERSPRRRRRFPCGETRREFVWQMGAGFAGVALSGLLEYNRLFSYEELPEALKAYV